jgi:hypothetical protein
MLVIDWNPDVRQLRKFGIWLGILALVCCGLVILRGHFTAGCIIGVCGVFLGLLCVLFRPGGLVVYRLWMYISLVLGKIVFPVVLGVVFFVIVTPLGIVMRMVGRDPLVLRQPKELSLWRDLPLSAKKPESFLHQF